MEIKDGPAEANLMDAPEMAVTPAPAAGQLRQSPDGANSSVIDATSTCGGGAGGGRGSVANLDNVVDEETAETPLLVSMKLIHYKTYLFPFPPSPLILILLNVVCGQVFFIYLTNFIIIMYAYVHYEKDLLFIPGTRGE